MKMIVSRIVLAPVLVAILAGCSSREDQSTLEGQAAIRILTWLKWCELENPGTKITNLAQLFGILDKGYPYDWERNFRAYGSSAGFTNSIFEKYIFFPSGISNELIEGEVVFMNAQPYPNPKGDLERNVVSKSAAHFSRRTLREEHVQRLFRQAGISEPKLLEMPRPPQAPPMERYREPFAIRLERLFERAAWKIGIPGVSGETLRRGTYGIVLLLAAAGVSWFTVWFLRRKESK